MRFLNVSKMTGREVACIWEDRLDVRVSTGFRCRVLDSLQLAYLSYVFPISRSGNLVFSARVGAWWGLWPNLSEKGAPTSAEGLQRGIIP